MTVVEAAKNTNPFGVSITVEDIVDSISFFDDWEERYKYIIDLGKELPAIDDENKTDDKLVRGCQSQVWLDYHTENDQLWFQSDSDAFIVKGLLGVVLAAYNGKSRGEILAFDIESYFDTLGLLKHLSPTRGNGMRAIVKKIQSIAS